MSSRASLLLALIELRDDVGRTPGQEQLLNDALFALSSQELFGGLPEAVASVRQHVEFPVRWWRRRGETLADLRGLGVA